MDIALQFQEKFQQTAQYLLRAPGRINLIGEHTDYNEGFVLPQAINLEIKMAMFPRPDNIVHIYSSNSTRDCHFSLEQIKKESNDDWSIYVKGVASALKMKNYPLLGFDAVIQSNLPQGAGLSSSAALELIIARAFSLTSDIEWHAKSMARLAQEAENNWVGVHCGIMDQMIIACAKENHALLIDCRNLSTKNIPLPKDIAVVIMDTNTRRGLVNSAYNDRRQKCEEAASLLAVSSLRDINLEKLKQKSSRLPQECLKRAKHVISENERVLAAVDAMQKNNPTKLGELINASHQSLQNNYEVSSYELDTIVSIAQKQPECFGARMTGAGFAGCAIAVVKADLAQNFASKVAENYHKITKLKPTLYISTAVNGIQAFKMEK